MNFGAHSEHLPLGSLIDELDQTFRRAESVGLLADLPTALGVDDDLDAGVARAHLIDVAGKEALMHGAMALPEEDAAVLELLFCLAAAIFTKLDGPRIPDGHLVQRNAHGVAGVAPQVLVGQEENALAAGEGPLEGGASVRGGADQPAAFAAKGLDGGRRIHVGQRQGLVGEAEVFEGLPTGLHLRDFGHVGH